MYSDPQCHMQWMEGWILRALRSTSLKPQYRESAEAFAQWADHFFHFLADGYSANTTIEPVAGKDWTFLLKWVEHTRHGVIFLKWPLPFDVEEIGTGEDEGLTHKETLASLEHFVKQALHNQNFRNGLKNTQGMMAYLQSWYPFWLEGFDAEGRIDLMQGGMLRVVLVDGDIREQIYIDVEALKREVQEGGTRG